MSLPSDYTIPEMLGRPLPDPAAAGQIPISEFITSPGVVDFNTPYNSFFRSYVSDKPYIKMTTLLDGDYAIAYAPVERMGQIAKDLGLDYINIFPYVCSLSDDVALAEAGIISVQQQPNLDLRGSGVLMGFVDTGIDFTKDAFKYEDGTSKIRYIWDQTIDEGPPPASFFSGTEYSQKKLSEALLSGDPLNIIPHRDDDGHGTFLASVGASREKGKYIGAAPDSEIIMVKLRRARPYYLNKYAVPSWQENAFESSDVMLGVHYILLKAAELGQPVSICLGVGSNFGSHDGTSLFEQYLYLIAGKNGVSLCVAVGNEANKKHHMMGKLENTGDTGDIDIRVAGQAEHLALAVWTSAYDRFSVSVRSPTGEVVTKVAIQAADVVFTRKLVLERSVVSVQYYLGENNLAFVKIDEPTPGIWTVTVHGDIVLDGDYHAWMPTAPLISPGIEFLSPSPNYTTTIPSTAIGPISVGAYNSWDGSLYIASSWGPTRLPVIIPDLVAPGVNINGIFPHGYGIMSGTSIAAAITAGACAIMLQWGIIDGNDSYINTYKLRSFLVRGCERSENLRYPNIQWGYGILNLINTFNLLKKL
ncbi:hypothetical protein FACS1894105_13190 [Clostridia bacterium]|nr:hypothetical protein FACS1894105_13190 [Clostridia bacterium]